MAVLTTSATAATISTLITRVRRMLGDNIGSVSGQKFANADILSALDDQLALMWNQLYEDAGPMLVEASLTYTANSHSVALSTTPPLGQLQIFKVEDIDNSLNPLFIDFVGNLDLERDAYQSGWALIGDAIALRPKPPANKTLRISYLRNYVPISGSVAQSTDQHPLSANHEEYLVTGAAIILQTIDDEGSIARQKRYDTELKPAFENYVHRFKGPAYVRETRLYG